jgi:hypothetical protein
MMRTRRKCERNATASARATFVIACALAIAPWAAHAQLTLPSLGESARSVQPPSAERASGPSVANALDSARAASTRLIQDSSLQSRLQELAANLSGAGPHAVSSRLGEKVISMIRMLPKADDEARQALLNRLEAMAKDGTPEALTFLGFAAEQGAYGIPRSLEKAAALYRAASQSGYQPALYDLALMNAYGRAMPRNLGEAEQLLARAVAAGVEGSNRVCGMASFVAYRLNDRAAMRNFSEGCNGPLSALAAAAVNPTVTDSNLVNRIKGSIATGVDDGYVALEVVTKANAANDTEFNYCLWSLVNQYRAQPSSPAIAPAAAACVERVATPGSKVATLAPQARQQAALAIAHMVGSQVQELAASRKANNFHFGKPVPYLPFTQEDVDLFVGAFDASLKQ